MRTPATLKRACAALALIGALAGIARAGDPLEELFSFDEEDGGYPDTDLVRDADGNLYGMTVEGGEFNGGTVFMLSPDGAGGWTHTILYSFMGGQDGGQPYGGVTLDADGNLYGTAVVGGLGGACEDGCGVAFKLTKNGSTWTQSVIHDFTGGEDGSGPGGPMTFDHRGRLYGFTPIGGEFGAGTIFQLTPQPNGDWTKLSIHDFTGGEDGGSGSAGRLLIDETGVISGVATTGGVNGVGVVFRMTPLPGNAWDYDVLYAFQGAPDGVFPYGGLVRDSAGRLFGTTYYGGTKDVGVVYQLEDVGGTWTETVLHSFKGRRDGASSISGLLLDAAGNLYGTSSEGGSACNCGTIFKLSPTPAGGWTESVVYRFQGTPDGRYPYAGLVADPEGNLYGATVRGGEDDDGIAFRFTPGP